MLGLMLNLPVREVEAIFTKYSDPCDRLLHIIIAFLRQAEPRPTWRVIVGALRSPIVNLTALARRVEAAQFPDLATTRDMVPVNTGESLSVPLTCVSHILSFQALSQQSMTLLQQLWTQQHQLNNSLPLNSNLAHSRPLVSSLNSCLGTYHSFRK